MDAVVRTQAANLAEGVLLALRWRDIQVVLHVCEGEIARRVAHLLGLEVEVPAADAAEYDISVVMASDGYRVAWRGAVRVVSCREDMLLYVVTLVSAAFLRKAPLLVLHAGTIVVHGAAVLFSGPPRVGKSTLALAAWQSGLPVIGDDWIVLDPQGMWVEPFPKSLKPRLRPTEAPLSLRRRCATDDYLAGWLNGEPRLVLGRHLEHMVPLERRFPLTALYYLERQVTGQSRVSPLRGHDALRCVLAQLMVTRAPAGLAVLRPLQALLQQHAVHRLSVGHHDTLGALAYLTQLRQAVDTSLR
jgi:hypothetical protein